MRLVLVALLLSVLCGAALVSPAEAQESWTCTLNFADGMPSGWSNAGTITSSGVQTSYVSPGYYLAQVNFPTSITLTSVTITFHRPTSVYANYGGALLTYADSTSSGTFTRSGSGSAVGGNWYMATGSSSAMYIVSADMTGTGTNPCPATPTPTPTNTSIPPTATFTTTPVPPTATPEPMIINTFATPTPITIDAAGVYEALNQANNDIVGLPPDLSVAGRPPAEDGSEVFGYVKWLVSPSSADEIAGPFAPVISHTGIFLSLIFVMAAVYAVIWAAVWLLRFVVWLFKFIVMLVDLVLQVAQAIGAFIGGVIKFFLGG